MSIAAQITQKHKDGGTTEQRAGRKNLSVDGQEVKPEIDLHRVHDGIDWSSTCNVESGGDLVKVTIQYFDGCPHWRLADRRVQHVLGALSRADVTVEYQLIETPEAAERAGFRGSPTILVDGRDPFVSGNEPIGLSCRVYHTEAGAQGAPTEAQLRRIIARDLGS